MDRSAVFAKAPRGRDEARVNTNDTSIARLITIFCFWKLLLIVIAGASPGPGYDTSTEILIRRHSDIAGSWFEHFVIRLTRWDGLYFASAAERGPVFEQQWAFSPFLARVTSLLTTGIAISHISHLIAVLLLFQLTYEILPASDDRKRQIAFTTACLHILSPAGLFLSAPYGESAFAMANFAGLLCYVKARRTAQEPRNDGAVESTLWTITSGMAFGFATMIRSNGLFNGLMFAWDTIDSLPDLVQILRHRRWPGLLRIMGTLIAGISIALGYALPQMVAYIEYCTAGNDRSWCNSLLPSIYSFVQSHYWGVGFLRYWTMSNLPLFALAIPMLLILTATSYASLDRRQLDYMVDLVAIGKTPTRSGQPPSRYLFRHTMRRFALPQMVLAVLALTSFHVQIVNRISSGYPVWYILLAIAINITPVAGKAQGSAIVPISKHAEWLVRSSVMYAIVQGGLYASFMPPA